MSADGFLSWHRTSSGTFFLLDQVYLDGRSYTTMGEIGEALRSTDADGVVLIPTHTGRSVVQVPFRGEGAPLVGDRKDFDVSFIADDEDDYRRFITAKSRGRLVDFCYGDWMIETFFAQVGATYGLSRSSADAVLVAPDGVSLAPRFFVGESEDPGIGSVSGSRFTSAVSGEVQVYYMPVYRVAVGTLTRDLADTNTLVLTATLQESGSPDFSLG